MLLLCLKTPVASSHDLKDEVYLAAECQSVRGLPEKENQSEVRSLSLSSIYLSIKRFISRTWFL